MSKVYTSERMGQGMVGKREADTKAETVCDDTRSGQTCLLGVWVSEPINTPPATAQTADFYTDDVQERRRWADERMEAWSNGRS